MKRRLYLGRDVNRAHSIDDLRAMARRRLPNFCFEYIDGGAEDEATLRRNRDVLSNASTVALEDVVQRAGGRVWMQVYMYRTRVRRKARATLACGRNRSAGRHDGQRGVRQTRMGSAQLHQAVDARLAQQVRRAGPPALDEQRALAKRDAALCESRRPVTAGADQREGCDDYAGSAARSVAVLGRHPLAA